VSRGSPTLSTSASVAGAGSWPTCSFVAQRSARLSSRAPRSSSSPSATAWENGSQRRPPRSSAGSSSGSSPEIVSSTNAPRPSSRVAPTRPTQPLVASASHSVTCGSTSSAGKRSITPLTYGAVESACGAHHSLASQSNRRPGIARTASTMSARYGNANTTCA
jgi:hypothetical protein